MVDEDGLMGMRVAQLRGERSQKSVADEMRLRGWKWSQATMWSIERGDRPLKVREAKELAEVLGIELMDLFQEPAILSIEKEIKELVLNVKRDHDAAVTQLQKLRSSHQLLQDRASDSSLKDDDRLAPITKLAKDTLERSTFDLAVTRAKSGLGLPEIFFDETD
ncbi:helix-turn-helix transcriptional regulator [Arthrobacter sp. AL08]|uniref:helix-turn-helix transcriptional regulator n=1 Tax=unclassified Arthrobacter TaxID=235627 RepID=UPI00249B1623|nr:MULTISPECIES: helix-turn-helix transcriptional regulator [unclassified Arthrobacter]MDI3241641.1 helix-turn-helix transcriptional regulator [Arthrobacter sp. AL05]MDI3277651.1 helix-turn-helix transcriptional regulator [Arthrobacter sp. AL08]